MPKHVGTNSVAGVLASILQSYIVYYVGFVVIHIIYNILYIPVTLRPKAGYGFLIQEVSRPHTTTHHSLYDSSGQVISSSQSPLPDNKQQ